MANWTRRGFLGSLSGASGRNVVWRLSRGLPRGNGRGTDLSKSQTSGAPSSAETR